MVYIEYQEKNLHWKTCQALEQAAQTRIHYFWRYLRHAQVALGAWRRCGFGSAGLTVGLNDPTKQFCDSVLAHRKCLYWCLQCGQELHSRDTIEESVLNTEHSYLSEALRTRRRWRWRRQTEPYQCHPPWDRTCVHITSANWLGVVSVWCSMGALRAAAKRCCFRTHIW